MKTVNRSLKLYLQGPRASQKVVNFLQQRNPAIRGSSELSPRENEILHLLGKGFLYKEIAQKLGIVTGTVRQHIHHIYEKLHVENRTEAINKVFGEQKRAQ
jgi:DNA-binding NarL/FixJ family response regulator